MTPQEIHQKLQSKFGDAILESNFEAFDPWIRIKPEVTAEVSKFLKDDPDLKFDSLMCLSGMDYGADSELGVVYNDPSPQNCHSRERAARQSEGTVGGANLAHSGLARARGV